MTIRFQCECGRVLMASDEQVGLEGKCPACGKVTRVPEADTRDTKEHEESFSEEPEESFPKEREERLSAEEFEEGDTAEEVSAGIEGLKDLESEAEDRSERKIWSRSPRFAMLASIIVVVAVAVVVFMVVRREKQPGEKVVAIKEIQPLVESEEETLAPPVGALLEEVEEEAPQLMEDQPAPGPIVEEETIGEVSAEPAVGEETESVPVEEEPEVVASVPEETQPARKTPPAGAYTINMASFKEKENADQYIEELKSKGIDAFGWEIDLPEKGKWYRVSVGGFSTREEAENYVNELREKGISQIFITKVPGSS